MYLELSEEQKLIQQTARDFARAELEPLAAKLDREDDRPVFLANLRKLAELGFMGLNVKGHHGGSEAGVVAFSVAMTEIARACASTAVTVSVNNMICEVIQAVGSAEGGTLDGRPPEIPTSGGDARCEMGASRASGIYDAFSIAQRGYVDLGFLGGAEVDQYGNVNTTVIGDYLNPELRLTGSGGNPDINSFAKRTVFIMVHEKRRFTENVSYITSPGWRVKKWPDGEESSTLSTRHSTRTRSSFLR